MAAPTLKVIRISSPGTTYNNVIKRLNESSVTTPYGLWIGAGASSGNERDDFGNGLAGQWAIPSVLVLQFDGNTVSNLTFKIWDAVSNQQDLTSPAWDFRIKLLKDYVDPTTIAAGTMAAWDAIPTGVVATPYSLDSNRPNPGNDGTSTLLTAHNSVAGRYLTNFYLYWTVKPDANADAGEHIDWAPRINYIWPNA